MAKRKRYPLGAFLKQFSTEARCQKYLASLRWKEGVRVPQMWLLPHLPAVQWTVSVRPMPLSGFRYGRDCAPQDPYVPEWFLAFYLVYQDKRGISAVQLCSQLGTAYKTAWYMLRRIRAGIGQQDERHQLSGIIEFDDSYFGGPTVGQKWGRYRKAKVFVALSLSRSGNPLYLKMKVTPNIKQASVEIFARSAFAEGSTIRSDGYRSYIPALEG